jgi:hypothetical protein
MLVDRRDGSRLERPDLVRSMASFCVVGSRATKNILLLLLVLLPLSFLPPAALHRVVVVVGNGWHG